MVTESKGPFYATMRIGHGYKDDKGVAQNVTYKAGDQVDVALFKPEEIADLRVKGTITDKPVKPLSNATVDNARSFAVQKRADAEKAELEAVAAELALKKAIDDVQTPEILAQKAKDDTAAKERADKVAADALKSFGQKQVAPVPPVTPTPAPATTPPHSLPPVFPPAPRPT